MDITAGAELIKRIQKVEEGIGEKTNWRVRITDTLEQIPRVQQ